MKKTGRRGKNPKQLQRRKKKKKKPNTGPTKSLHGSGNGVSRGRRLPGGNLGGTKRRTEKHTGVNGLVHRVEKTFSEKAGAFGKKKIGEKRKKNKFSMNQENQ